MQFDCFSKEFYPVKRKNRVIFFSFRVDFICGSLYTIAAMEFNGRFRNF